MSTLFSDFSTEDLRRIRSDLRSHIPGDATWSAAVSRLLGHLVNFDLADSERAARDNALAEEIAAARKADANPPAEAA